VTEGAARCERSGGVTPRSGLDAVVGDEVSRVAVGGGDAGGGDGLAAGDGGGDGEIEFEELGEAIFFGGDVVGVEHGGVEGGVGVFEGVPAVEFEATIDCSECLLFVCERTSAFIPERLGCATNRLDLAFGRSLRP